ncbi:MAG: DUF192 domain-containing protein, partial [Vicinamibacterales bacterium]
PPRGVETPRRRVSNHAGIARFGTIFCTIAALLAACNGADDTPPSPTTADPPGLTHITFTNENGDGIDLLVEVADSPEERSRGLMFRKSLPEDQGMLFVFEQDGQHNFWMKDTLIPLSIAFVKSDGTIVEMEDMAPQTEDLHSGPEPYLYAVEANESWFARNGIDTRSNVQIACKPPTETPQATPSP